MNGDITLEARWQWQSAAEVISPFIIFAVFDVSFRRYKCFFLHLLGIYLLKKAITELYYNISLAIAFSILTLSFINHRCKGLFRHRPLTSSFGWWITGTVFNNTNMSYTWHITSNTICTSIFLCSSNLLQIKYFNMDHLHKVIRDSKNVTGNGLSGWIEIFYPNTNILIKCVSSITMSLGVIFPHSRLLL